MAHQDGIEQAGRAADGDAAVRFRARLLDAAAEAIIATDRQLRITYCNAGTEGLLRRTREETIGLSATALVAPDRAEDIERIEHLLGAGRVVRDFETVLRRADGTDVDVSVSMSNQTTPSGEPAGAIAIVRDITERVRVERAAAANAARANRAEREVMRAAAERAAAERASQAKSELLSRVSHELRTPLNSVLGFAQLLDDAQLEDPLDRRSVAQILQAAQRLVELTDDVLGFARATEAGGRSARARQEERDLTILFVADDPSHLRALEVVVEGRDQVNLVTTTEGRRGIELAREIRPDLLLLSASLSDLPTRDALTQLRADGAMESTWVVVVDALDEAEPAEDEGSAAEGCCTPMGLGRLVRLVEGLATDADVRGAA